MTILDEAQARVDALRADIAPILDNLEEALKRDLEAVFEGIFEITYIKQLEVSENLGPEGRGTLQYNFVQARASALAAVRGKVLAIDIDKVSDLVVRTARGERYVQTPPILSQLIAPAGDLLKSAGYSTADFAAHSGAGYNVTLLQLPTHAGPVARRLDEAIEKLGHAKRHLRELDVTERQQKIRDEWNQRP